MTGWIMVAGAVVSNVVANVALKHTLTAAGAPEALPAFLRQVMATPSFWIFAVSAGLLLVFYALSLRAFDLPIVYASVTTLALVGVTFASAWLFGDALTIPKIAGTSLIVVGIILITRS